MNEKEEFFGGQGARLCVPIALDLPMVTRNNRASSFIKFSHGHKGPAKKSVSGSNF